MRIDLSQHNSSLRDGHCAIIVSRDVKSSCQHRALNTDKCPVRQFHIDGDVIPSDNAGKRCDFLVLNDGKASAYYIELKGSDIEYAIEQILATESYCISSLSDYTSFYRVVYRSATHELRGSKILSLRQRYKGRLVVKEKLLEERI